MDTRLPGDILQEKILKEKGRITLGDSWAIDDANKMAVHLKCRECDKFIDTDYKKHIPCHCPCFPDGIPEGVRLINHYLGEMPKDADEDKWFKANRCRQFVHRIEDGEKVFCW